MAANPPLKSILKPSSTTTPKTPLPLTSSNKQTRDRALAFHHAQIIRARRDTEDLIFRSLESLLSFPLSPTSTSTHPSPSDITAFKAHLRPFRPRDYDDLILERNLDGKCGYSLCPRPRMRDESVQDGAKRIVGRGKDTRVVRKEELERWCDGGNGGEKDGCKRRALWVRVQLSETPAWEREGRGEDVELLSEGRDRQEQLRAGGDDAVVKRSEKLGSEADDAVGLKKPGESALALERGDRGLTAKNGLVDVNIEENATGPAEPPKLDNDLSNRLETMHLALEGYTPSFGREGQRAGRDEYGTELSDLI